jgi:hypothetical protein
MLLTEMSAPLVYAGIGLALWGGAGFGALDGVGFGPGRSVSTWMGAAISRRSDRATVVRVILNSKNHSRWVGMAASVLILSISLAGMVPACGFLESGED